MTRLDTASRAVALALAALLPAPPTLFAHSTTQDAPARPDEAESPQDRAERVLLARKLADVELILDVEGDVAGARMALALVAADITRTLGPAEATELLERVAELQARLDAARPVAQAADLVDTVLEAVERNNMPTLEQLGSRAVDVIERALLEPEASPGAGPSSSDLLYAMLLLDPHRSYALVPRLAQSGRVVPAETLFSVMDRTGVLRSWVHVSGRPPDLLEPGWLDVFAEMLGSREFVSRSNTWNRVGACLHELVTHDAITPEIVEALSHYTLATDALFMRNHVLTSLSTPVQFPSLKPLLDVLARHPDERVRSGAAHMLAGYRDSDVLRALVDDPYAEVRLAVARLIRPKYVSTMQWLDRQGRSKTSDEWTVPVVDDEARQIMTRLLADENPGVREEALLSAGTFDVPLDLEAYVPLVDDPDPGVRASLAANLPVRLPGAEDLMLDLVRRGEASTIGAVASRLASTPADSSQDLLNGDNLARFLPVLSAVSASAAVKDDAVDRIWRRVVEQPDGSLMLLAEAVRSDNDALVDRVVQGWGAGPQTASIRRLLEMDPSALEHLLPCIARSGWMIFSKIVHEAARSAPEGAVAAMAALAEDEHLEPSVRLSAMSVVAARGRESWEPLLFALLASDAVRASDPEGNLLEELSRRLPSGDRNRVLLRVMNESGLPDGLLLPLIYGFDAYAPHGEELSIAVLQRWHDDATGPTEEALYPAIERAGSMAGRIDPALVIATARNPHPDVAGLAVRAMGRLRDPVFLPVLRECLEKNWLSENDQGDLAVYATRALTGYMSDEAAAILLEGAASAPGASLRTSCMEGVRAIQEYQDARALWERRAGTRATRDDAVLELVRMLDDEDATIRAECLRGLGLLGAVDHLPRVILGLRDPDAGVREAAREALDRFNSLETPAGASASEDDGEDAGEDAGDEEHGSGR